MTLLDVCSGVGGFSLTLKYLVGDFVTIGYIEIDPYCQKVLQQRIRDGILDDAPIFSDLRDFDGERYHNKVDCLSAGFPCPKFSSARRGQGNPEDLWPEIWRVIQRCSPSITFLENVQRYPIFQAKRDLGILGFHSNIARIDSASVGGKNKGSRYWLVATTNGNSQPGLPFDDEMAFLPPARSSFWENQPVIVGMDNGVPHKMDRLKATGNAIVPAVATVAWERLK